MKKVVILGCENTHATTFLKIIEKGGFENMQIIGAYSDDGISAQKLNERFGIKVMKTFDEAVEEADGVIITARHGDKHFKYALPYIKEGKVMFIDKPITIKEDEAVLLAKKLKANNVMVTGGSSCKHLKFIQELKKQHQNVVGGKTISGFIRTPIMMNSPHGEFFFYGQHAVDMALEIYGSDIIKVRAIQNEDSVTAILMYKDFNVTLNYCESNYLYYASRNAKDSVSGSVMEVAEETPCFKQELLAFYDLLQGKNNKCDYNLFIKPVFVMNAIYRSIKSGKDEIINEYVI